MWNIPFYCVNVRCCDWCNKEADWPLARQSKVKRENQMRILGSRRVEPEESPARWKGSSTCERGQSHRLPDLYKKRWMQESWDSGESGPKKVSYLEQAWPQLPLVSSFSLHLFLPGYAVPKGGITRHQTGGATESWAFSLKSIEVDESFFSLQSS